MPARGSRCLSPLDCFTDDDGDAPGPKRGDAFFPAPDPESEPQAVRTFIPLTESICLSPTDEEEDGDASTAESEAEDREWEECMERRRMMFAQMCRSPFGSRESDGEGGVGSDVIQHEERRFEGYTSISASLVAMLASAGLGGPASGPTGLTYAQHLTREAATPVGTPVELEAVLVVPHPEAVDEDTTAAAAAGPSSHTFGTARPKLLRGAHRLRSSFGPEDEVVEESEAEEEAESREDEDAHPQEAYPQPCADTVMTALRAFGVRPGRELRSGDEERDRE